MGGVEGKVSRRRAWLTFVAITFLAVVVLAWLGQRRGWFPTPQPKLIVLYGYSTLDEVMQEAILPSFRNHWLEEQGEEVEFVTTFAGSGEITDKILHRFPAEVAIVSSELDAYSLPVPWESWTQLPHRGVLARTPLVFVVREGNPKAIARYEDLTRSGVDVIHGDPGRSGLANLAILAEYGSALRRSQDQDVAYRQLLGIWKNTSTRLPNARAVHRHFDTGAGDVLITYRQDALGSPPEQRVRGEIIYPGSTILSEPIVATIDKNITRSQRPMIDAFVAYLWSREAQQILVDYGFHSVLEELNTADSHADIEDAFTLEDLGGARAARLEILEAVWKDRVVPELPH